jgi:6-phospho-beta-glucosidase
MKLSLIGGAGVRTPTMIYGLIRRHQDIPIDVLYIHDINQEKIDSIGAIVQHIVQINGSPFMVVITSDFTKAVEGADFIYMAIRVGGENGRATDERVALNHGVLGQETTGPGGFSMALRTIPVILEYAKIIEKTAPNAWVINFTNPAGLITEALHKHTRLKAIGICDAPSSMKLDIAKFLNEPVDSIYLNYFGLNHLGLINKVLVRGQDRLKEIVDGYDRFTEACPHMACFSGELIQQLNMIPNEYLYYFYSREQAVKHILSSRQTRGEQIAELNSKLLIQLQGELKHGRIEEAFLAYSKIMMERQNSYMLAETGQALPQVHASPEVYENEGYAGLAMSVMDAIYNNKKTNLIVNVPNQGAIQDLQIDDIVEVPCILDANGPVPLAVGTLPYAVKGLVQSVKQYERYAVSAAVNGSYDDALMALTVHPLVSSYSLAKPLVDEYLNKFKKQLPQFNLN